MADLETLKMLINRGIPVVLQNAQLSEADLAGANLVDAELTGANLTGADLRGADLDSSYLTGANLTSANLTGANLGGADLTDADLTSADLTGADLAGANLVGANLVGANLAGADLRGANLDSAYLAGANLEGAYLTDADLTSANLESAYLTGANLTRAILTGANLTRAILTRAILTRAILTGADLTDVSLEYADLTGANLTGADLTGADLTGANLTGADLNEADLTGANLAGADLTGADFTEAINPPLRNGPMVRVNAMQVHEEAAKINYNKLNELLSKNSGPIPADINYPVFNVNYPVFIRNKLEEFISKFEDPREKSELTIRLNSIMDQRLNGIDYGGLSPLVLRSIFYGLSYVSVQTDEFKKIYVETFTHDCVHSYNGPNGMTCAVGALERILFSLLPACVASPTPECENIVSIIAANRDKLAEMYIQDWYKLHTREKFVAGVDRRANLLTFLQENLPNEDPVWMDTKIVSFADPIGYDDDDFGFEGGRKKRRTIKRRGKTKRIKHVGKTKRIKMSLFPTKFQRSKEKASKILFPTGPEGSPLPLLLPPGEGPPFCSTRGQSPLPKGPPFCSTFFKSGFSKSGFSKREMKHVGKTKRIKRNRRGRSNTK